MHTEAATCIAAVDFCKDTRLVLYGVREAIGTIEALTFERRVPTENIVYELLTLNNGLGRKSEHDGWTLTRPKEISSVRVRGARLTMCESGCTP